MRRQPDWSIFFDFRFQILCKLNAANGAHGGSVYRCVMNRFTPILRTLLPATVICFAVPAFAQNVPPNGDPPVVFHVDVVSRTTKAINYQHRQGSTSLTLLGSSFAPRAKGEVRVDSKTGATKVDASIERMPPASAISEGCLTYVLWAITPEGRAENMGELFLDGDHARLQAATELQTFGMIVTAEPYDLRRRPPSRATTS